MHVFAMIFSLFLFGALIRMMIDEYNGYKQAVNDYKKLLK